jgi:hypothetical protein
MGVELDGQIIHEYLTPRRLSLPLTDGKERPLARCECSHRASRLLCVRRPPHAPPPKPRDPRRLALRQPVPCRPRRRRGCGPGQVSPARTCLGASTPALAVASWPGAGLLVCPATVPCRCACRAGRGSAGRSALSTAAGRSCPFGADEYDRQAFTQRATPMNHGAGRDPRTRRPAEVLHHRDRPQHTTSPPEAVCCLSFILAPAAFSIAA